MLMVGRMIPESGHASLGHTHWHLRDAHELAREHGVDPALGLAEAEAALRAVQHGPNEIAAGERRTPAACCSTSSDFMILVLLGAAVVSGPDRRSGRHAGHRGDRAAQCADRLRAGLARRSRPWRRCSNCGGTRHRAARGGRRVTIPASRPVPGDIVLLEPATRCRPTRLTIAQLRIDESALTGESVAVDKHVRSLSEAGAALGDRLNMAFKGTTARHGRGTGLVVATGMATELGKVAGPLDRVRRTANAAAAPGRLRAPRAGGAGDLRD